MMCLSPEKKILSPEIFRASKTALQGAVRGVLRMAGGSCFVLRCKIFGWRYLVLKARSGEGKRLGMKAFSPAFLRIY